MFGKAVFFFGVLVVLCVVHVAHSSSEVDSPPTIDPGVQKSEQAYKSNEPVELHCHARGVPAPTIWWMKNEVALNMTDSSRYAFNSATGTLTIKKAVEDDDGNYNCRAANKFGTAVGMTIRLQAAFVKTYDKTDKNVDRPTVGDYHVIKCSAPPSYPKGSLYLGYNSPIKNQLQAITTDNRVILDYEGNLHFANVYMNDSLDYIKTNRDDPNSVNYMCVLNNAFMGVYVQGHDRQLDPRQANAGGPTYYAPQLRYPLSTAQVAIKGFERKLKCIFSGLPTPEISWHAENMAGAPIKSFNLTKDGAGTEIVLFNVDTYHEGYYTCTAKNSETGRPAAHRIHLTVESPPMWARAPIDHYVDEEDDVEIDCQVHGRPDPNITWSINGNQVTESSFQGQSQKSLKGFKLSYKSVTVNDSQVVQCSSSNRHGTILANIILKVRAEKPSFIEKISDKKVVEGETVQFQCSPRGAPKPTIEWFKGNSQTRLPSNQHGVSGRLDIRNTKVDDTDTYRCVATNKYGKNEASFTLTVRLPTLITSNPVNRVVVASTEVVIPCGVTTDPNERSKLVVDWQKNGKRIDFTTETHMEMDKNDYSLRIKSSKVKDTANYTCNASNGLDSASSAPSTLRVKDRPDPPHGVQIYSCNSTRVGISWFAGHDNNDRITEFTIYYSSNSSSGNKTVFVPGNTNFDPTIPFHETITSLRPWSRYTFHVTATNGIGTSGLSDNSGQVCNTPPVAPFRNPTGVCGNLSSASQLVIVWDPMPESEHNGEGFQYIVGYKRHRSSERETTKIVSDPKLRSISIHGQREPFVKYEVYVRAANKLGSAQEEPERQLVRSGEGSPEVVPLNFELEGDSVNGSSALFSWDPVDTNEEKVRGFFRGYRIVFWKTAEPNVRGHEDILISKPFSLCTPLPFAPPTVEPESQKRRRRHHHQRHHLRTRSTDRVFGATNKLWPLSDISAAVQVFNQANHGEKSNVVEFRTPVGVPGKVSELRVVGRGWSHLVVEWQLPSEFTGDIVGFRLDYDIASAGVGDPAHLTLNDPHQRRYKIQRLDSTTKYRIAVTALTVAGPGEMESVIGETLGRSDPDAPVIRDITTYDNSANVSWFHSDKFPPVNPGSDFFVKCKGPDNSTVVRTINPDPDSDDNWANITGLERGKYEVWVVAKSQNAVGIATESQSSIWIVYIGLKNNTVIRPETKPLISQQATAGWFIILMCIIALLLVVLLIVCILRRTRGDMYPVYEKEKMWRHHPLEPDETPFGEYTPSSDNPHLTRSQGSLDSDEKPMESDSDSLEEYEDQDASKFNEDGSFIGQYTGKQKQDTMRPTAINTSV